MGIMGKKVESTGPSSGRYYSAATIQNKMSDAVEWIDEYLAQQEDDEVVSITHAFTQRLQYSVMIVMKRGT